MKVRVKKARRDLKVLDERGFEIASNESGVDVEKTPFIIRLITTGDLVVVKETRAKSAEKKETEV